MRRPRKHHTYFRLRDGREVYWENGEISVQIALPRPNNSKGDIEQRARNLAPICLDLGGAYQGNTTIIGGLCDIFYGPSVYRPDFRLEERIHGYISDITVEAVILGDYSLQYPSVRGKIIQALDELHTDGVI